MHRKSISTSQTGTGSGREKAGKVLANLTAKYSLPSKKPLPEIGHANSKETGLTMYEPQEPLFDRGQSQDSNYSFISKSKPGTGMKHKRTKSDYIFSGQRQPSPSPTSAPLQNNYTKGQSSGMSSFKFLGGPSENGGLPDIRPQIPKLEEPVTDSAHNKTTITNNTNIIVIGGRTCKISTLSGSPPEIIQYNTRVPTKDPRAGCRSVSRKAAAQVQESGLSSLIRRKYMSIIKPQSHDDSSDAARVLKAYSVIAHKRSVSDAHGGSKKGILDPSSVEFPCSGQAPPALRVGGGNKQGRPKAAGVRYLGKVKARKTSTAASVAGSNMSSVVSSIVAKPMTDQHTQENSMELLYSLERAYHSGAGEGKRDSESVRRPVLVNNVDLLQKEDVRLAICTSILHMWRENKL